MKKMLITGGTGFLGSRIADYYRDKYDVYCPTHTEMELTNKESLKNCFLSLRPDVVIHCAAISNVQICEKEPERSQLINVEANVQIARLCHQINAKCVLCSSDQVYVGSHIKVPHLEDEIVVPTNVYGRQKREMEEKCLEQEPNAILLRLSWMYDAFPNNKPEHSDFFTNLYHALKEKTALSYPIYDKRGITDVNEVVQNLEKALELPGGVYNFGSYNDKNIYETVKKAFALASLNNSDIYANEEAFKGHPRNLCMRIDKIERYGISFLITTQGITKNLQNY